jgi:acetoin utilization deacetylase AcuC-like enzyme
MNLIPVYFRPEMVADVEVYSPSPKKPRPVVTDWHEQGLPIELWSFEPASISTLCLAHNEAFVADIYSLRQPNGFDNKDPEVAQSVPYTTGAMLAAAREALDNGKVACAPVSGFHHAGFDFAQGFCTFNGLMITAIALKKAGLVQRIGILDLDQHFGNGTEDIIERLEVDYVVHETAVKTYQPRAADAEGFLKSLPKRMRRFSTSDLLLYQAGADAHVDDPLGGWMTTEQLARRDQLVFETAASMNLPVAWNLAGGYQRLDNGSIEPVLAIHRNTMQVCVKTFCEGTDAAARVTDASVDSL